MKCVSLFSLFLLLCFFRLNAQNISPANQDSAALIPGCLTDQLLKAKLSTDPALAARHAWMNSRIASQPHAERQIRTIPVVVHIIHQQGPEEISDQQVIDGIVHLNAAFSNTGVYFNEDGVNTEIQFCLAVRDPSGGFTNGINRIYSPLTNMTAETDDQNLKSIIRWDQNSYLNIWLVKEITSLSMGSGIAGYAYFPSSQGYPEDGIVNEAAFFGSSTDNSKVHIHEVGHYLGLYHTFEEACSNNDCQLGGDRVCDTPPDNSTAPVLCNSAPNTCSSDQDDISLNNPFRPVANGGLGDQPDMFRNYMDYGFQSCQIYFSDGQSERMNSALSTSRAVLLESAGCITPCTLPIAFDFLADTTTIIAGEFVNFSNHTLNATLYEWRVNSQIVSNADSLSYFFATPGNYTVTLTASNSDENCMKTGSVVIHVECTSQAEFQLTSTDIEINPGDVVSTINTSANALGTFWYLDGNFVTQTNSWSQIFNVPGGHSIYLITSNGECEDTSLTQFFQVGNCSLSGVADNWIINKNTIQFFDNNTFVHSSESPIQTEGDQETSSSVSDADGNLLLFSDGMSVWDRNSNLMPNGSGLLGARSSTQCVLITPHPGNAQQFYVFTNDAVENNCLNGLRYSIVDMTLNGGLGDVLPGSKNTLLLSDASEKLSGTWHSNGRDIWIGSCSAVNDNFYAFLLDNEGVHHTPVISNIGVMVPGVGNGGMRFSHDGNLMAACILSDWPWRLILSDFNKSTGEYTDPKNLYFGTSTNIQPYMVEFSPDNSKLYLSTWQGGDLFQYDLTGTTETAIQASRIPVDPYLQGFFGYPVLARDGRIYVYGGQGGIDIIASPDNTGVNCNYISNAIPIGFEHYPGPDLPNLLQGYFSAHNPVIAGPFNICKGGSANNYGILLGSSQDSTIWTHTGPGTLIAQNGITTATLISADNEGTDVLMVTVYGRCGITHDTIVIHTNSPEITVPEDEIHICDSLILSPGNDFLSYEWQDGSNADSLIAYTANTYWVKVRGHSGCLITDTIEVTTVPLDQEADLGPDKSLCNWETVVLTTDVNYQEYEWQDGSENSSYTAFLPGIYWVTVSDGCNYSSDTIAVTETTQDLTISYNGEDTVCKIALPFILTAPDGFDSYLWSTGATTQSIDVTSIGTYGVTGTGSGCLSMDTVWVIDCLSIVDFTAEDFAVFPNPADDYLQIKGGKNKAVIVRLFSVSGQLLLDENRTGEKLVIATSDFADGLYLLEINSGINVSRKKVIIKH